MHFTEYDTRMAAYAVIVDAGRILLSWYNGGTRGGTSHWTLPGGGVEFDESLEQAVTREVREETGYIVEVGAPIATDSFAVPAVETQRPFKSVRVLFAATIMAGELGTLEEDGTTDFAAWVPLDEVPLESPVPEIVRLAVDYGHRISTMSAPTELGVPHD